MSKELIVSTGKHETRVAILEDDQLVEIFHEREKEYSLAGSIHKGRVTRVLPGMQSAFVDIGLERDAFLYVSDFFEDNEEYDAVVSTVEEKVLKMERAEALRPGRPELDSATAVRARKPLRRERRLRHGAVRLPPPVEARGPSADPEGIADRAPDRGGDRGGDRGDGRGRRGRRRRGGRAEAECPNRNFFRRARESAHKSEPRRVTKLLANLRYRRLPRARMTTLWCSPASRSRKYAEPERRNGPD